MTQKQHNMQFKPIVIQNSKDNKKNKTELNRKQACLIFY